LSGEAHALARDPRVARMYLGGGLSDSADEHAATPALVR
jgi:hypothetical protein